MELQLQAPALPDMASIQTSLRIHIPNMRRVNDKEIAAFTQHLESSLQPHLHHLQTLTHSDNELDLDTATLLLTNC